VLDHDPRNLPPGIESTVAGLDTADLRRAARASAALLTKVSASAAQQSPADLPSAMAGYVTHAVSRDRRQSSRRTTRPPGAGHRRVHADPSDSA
jgi:hypothetical protein